MADAQDLKTHFTLFQPVAHHRLPKAQTFDNKWVLSVHAFFHSLAKGRGSDPKSSTKSSTDQKQTAKYLLKSCASGKAIFPAARSRVVIAHRIAPRLPSQHCGQCRHHQSRACAGSSPFHDQQG
jgi:hypothetical protein